MGGNAFGQQLPEAQFPRLNSSLYTTIRDRILPVIQSFYTYAAVPAEAPQKKDHGDIDFVVSNGDTKPLTDPEDLRVALNAVRMIANPMGTNNYALVVQHYEWVQYGGDPQLITIGPIYCQVDINVAADKSIWERIIFLHSYGDLGMILCLIVRSAGLHLGTKGLHLSTLDGNPQFLLSISVDEISSFFGWDVAQWREGFNTKEKAFEWAASSCFFSAQDLIEPDNRSKKKEKAKRHMYGEFKEWSTNKYHQASTHNWTQEEVQKSALEFFGKSQEYDAVISAMKARQAELEGQRRQKEKLNGSKVSSWTGLNYWKDIKYIMDGVKIELGGDWAKLSDMDEDSIKNLTLKVSRE